MRPLLVWLSLWMLVVPFVHVHPDADHRHGMPKHLHGGTVHTVFSKDLACEFSAGDHPSVAPYGSRVPLHLLAHPLHGLEHPEFALALGSSAEPQSGKGTPLDTAAHFIQADDGLTSQTDWQRHPPVCPSSLLLATAHPSRAPPTS
ncbi:MAG: hypothetical protein AB7G68_11295 [Nitrospiraceae bacterium]